MILLGLGYTNGRLARRLLARGMEVHGVTRDPAKYRNLGSIGLRTTGFVANRLPRRATVVHSIPPEAGGVRAFLKDLDPARVIYISATSVYGETVVVDETTSPRPAGDKSTARYQEELWLTRNPWPNLILRSAAIYGPGRGVHEKIRTGRPPRGAGGLVSRIHVDDLAAILEAGIMSDLDGAWPVADERPAASEEVGAYCRRLLTVPAPSEAGPISGPPGRKVDGARIRDLLGVKLIYPSYESGILASLAEIATISGGDS